MKYTSLLILFFCAQFCFGQSAEEFMELAKTKVEVKDYNYALNLIKKSVEADTNDVWNRLLMAEILLNLDRVKEAKEQIEWAIQIDSTESEPYNRLGELFLNYNDLNSAVEYYNLAIQYAKSDSILFSYHLNRATAKGVLRDFEGSISDFEKAYEINPNDIVLLNNLAATYQEVGYKNKGIQMLKKSIAIFPDFIGPYVNLGLTYSEIDSLDLSEYYFNQALKIDPKEPLLLNNVGFLYYKKKEYNKALEYINQSINLYPNNSYAYRNRALVYIDMELMKEACSDLEIATYYDFKPRYGDEVEKLMIKYCKKD